MGTLAIAYLIWLTIAFIAVLLKMCLSCHRKIRRTYHVLQKKLFFNSLISLYLESYSLISVCCLINMSYLSFETYGLSVHSVSCIMFLALILLLPPLLCRHLVSIFEDLDERQVKHTFGSFYDELDLR